MSDTHEHQHGPGCDHGHDHTHDHGHDDGHASHGEVATNIIPETSIQDVVLKGLALSTAVIFGFIGYSWVQFPFEEPRHSVHPGHAAPAGHHGSDASKQLEHTSTPTEGGQTPAQHSAVPAESGQAPAEHTATPTESGQAPAEHAATPTEPGQAPVEAPAPSTDHH